jgi:hypothetical protein
MRIAIVGSRTFNDYEFVKQMFLQVLELEGLTLDNVEIVSGGARGVDSLAYRLAKELGIPIKVYFPNYHKHGRKAPLLRNTKIVNDADLVIAIPTPESKGTWDTINKASNKGIKVYIPKFGG